jgi:hypothetical protein
MEAWQFQLSTAAQSERTVAAAKAEAQKAAALLAARKAGAARKAAARRAALLADQKAAAQPAATRQTPTATPAPAHPSGSAQQIAMSMLGSYGWSSSQFSCLDPLWSRESGWNVSASNPDGAFGIPQAMPGSKMASAGPDWQTSAATQIKWASATSRTSTAHPAGPGRTRNPPAGTNAPVSSQAAVLSKIKSQDHWSGLAHPWAVFLQ